MKKWQAVLALIVCVMLLGVGWGVQGEEPIDMEFRDAAVADVFQILGELGGWNVLIDPSVSGNVSFVLEDLTVREALDLVSKATGFRYTIAGNTLVVASAARLRDEFAPREFAFFVPKNTSVADARQLANLITPEVKVFADSERGLLVLYGVAEDLRLVEEVLAQYDQQSPSTRDSEPAEVTVSSEPELVSDSVTVEYVSGSELVAVLNQRFAPRSFQWNATLGLVTGRATADEWIEIRNWIAQRDFPDFRVKGIVREQDKVLVLVDWENSTYLIQEGESLQGWRVAQVSDRMVSFMQGDREFSVNLRR